MFDFGEKRVRVLNNKELHKGLVLYWMSRDQRAEDNFALLYAQKLAKDQKQPLVVAFTLDYSYQGANLRHFDFMINGLKLTEEKLNQKKYSLIVLVGNPVEQIEKFVIEKQVKILVTDFDPLRIKRKWKSDLITRLDIPIFEVDTHNIVPCWLASDKEEYGAFTIRKKIKRLLPKYLVDIPELKKQQSNPFKNCSNDWSGFFATDNIDCSVLPSSILIPGSDAAKDVLDVFINERIEQYAQFKSNPNYAVTSHLSAYLHFGQISSQRIAVEILKSSDNSESFKAFLEELIIRKELADNFCYYNPNYDSVDGFKSWALKSLNEHVQDEREYLYSSKHLESAQTHDPLWNAAQLEMVKSGYMHGYMRMYWAKKILEWTMNPSDALQIANYLNDKYSLDGRGPNGYCGTAWSIGGIHDRAWAVRPVYGKIRYMNFNGCKRKFDVDAYISRVYLL
jgi:deoxyribodipyrimidine photo-lyase